MSHNRSVLVEHIPFLRRYAHALCGSRERGDEYVRACLETIAVAPPRRLGRADPCMQLFCTFHEVWNAFHEAMPQAPYGPSSAFEDRLEQSLDALSPLERQVLLLVALEEFSYQETAYILGISEREVTYYLRKARDTVALRTSASVLIIEDEFLIAMDLARIVEEMGHQVCGTAAGTAEAVDLAKRTNPTLLLADIRLDGEDSGISAVQQIRRRTRTPVVYVTGYPEKVVTEDEADPALVVSKPFEPEVLKAAMGQALFSRSPHVAA